MHRQEIAPYLPSSQRKLYHGNIIFMAAFQSTTQIVKQNKKQEQKQHKSYNMSILIFVTLTHSCDKDLHIDAALTNQQKSKK